MVIPQKLNHRIIVQSINSTSDVYPKELKARTHKYLYSCVLSSNIHCSQKVEAAQVSISKEWMNKT
jgi:hypothetical protein